MLQAVKAKAIHEMLMHHKRLRRALHKEQLGIVKLIIVTLGTTAV
jgi:hypothetical protein